MKKVYVIYDIFNDEYYWEFSGNIGFMKILSCMNEAKQFNSYENAELKIDYIFNNEYEILSGRVLEIKKIFVFSE